MKTVVVVFQDTKKVTRRQAEDLNGHAFENAKSLNDSLIEMFGEGNFGIVDMSVFQRELNDTDNDYRSPFLDGWVAFVSIQNNFCFGDECPSCGRDNSDYHNICTSEDCEANQRFVKVDEDAKTINVNGNVLSFEEVSLAYSNLAETVNQRIERECTGSAEFDVTLTQSFSRTFTVKADSAEDAIDYVDGCCALFTDADYVGESSVAEVVS